MHSLNTFERGSGQGLQHAVAVHHHDDTPELRAMLKQGIYEGQPAA